MEGKKYQVSYMNNDCIHPQNAHLLGFTQVLMKFIKPNGNIAKVYLKNISLPKINMDLWIPRNIKMKEVEY